MASIEQIQALLEKENKKLKEDLGKEIMQQVGPLIHKRLEALRFALSRPGRKLWRRRRIPQAQRLLSGLGPNPGPFPPSTS